MRKECPDCNEQLVNIQVMDRGYMDSQHKGLVYTPQNSKKGFFSLGPKQAGTIEAQMCGSCNRVLFYAVAKNCSFLAARVFHSPASLFIVNAHLIYGSAPGTNRIQGEF